MHQTNLLNVLFQCANLILEPILASFHILLAFVSRFLHDLADRGRQMLAFFCGKKELQCKWIFLVTIIMAPKPLVSFSRSKAAFRSAVTASARPRTSWILANAFVSRSICSASAVFDLFSFRSSSFLRRSISEMCDLAEFKEDSVATTRFDDLACSSRKSILNVFFLIFFLEFKVYRITFVCTLYRGQTLRHLNFAFLQFSFGRFLIR